MANGLETYTVIELTQGDAAALAAEYLALNGMRVIKVLAPGTVCTAKEERAPYVINNLNKQCVTLDVTKDAGRGVMLRLLEKADALIEDAPYGAMDAMGLGYADVKAVNPRLIYASLKPYPKDSPWRDLPATVTTLGAMGGATYLNGYKGYEPLTSGPNLPDTTSAAFLATGITACLYRRESDGEGRLLEVNQQEAMIAHCRSAFAAWYSKPTKNVRAGNGSPTLASIAPMDMYPTKGTPGEENFVMLGCKDEDMFHKLADAIGQPELKEDPRFLTWRERQENIAALTEILTAYTLQHDKFELMEYLLKERRIICSAVQTLDDVIANEELRQTGMLQKLDDPVLGEIWAPTWPAISDANRIRAAAPDEPGAANEAVYGTLLALSPDELAALRDAQVL